MRIKYSNQKQILSCSNEDFKLSLNVRFYEQDSGQQLFLFDPKDLFDFILVEFFDPKKYEDKRTCYKLFLRTFLYQGCCIPFENKSFVNATGLKQNSKFLNWFLNFDFNSAILRAKGLTTDNNVCEVCKQNDLGMNRAQKTPKSS